MQVRSIPINSDNKEQKISIIVPVYNCERWLVACLDSLVQMVIPRGITMEIILVDDGSTDGSGEICNRYAKVRDCIRVVHTENKGVSCARNIGIDEASGDWIIFVDSDDTLEPDTLQVLYEFRFYEYDVTRFGAFSFGKGKREPYKRNQSTKLSEQRYLLVTHKIAVGVWGGIYSRHLFENEEVRFTSGIRIGEDWLMEFKLLLNAKTYTYIDKELYGYRRNEDSVTRKKKKHVLPDSIIAFTCILEYAQEKGYVISPKDVAVMISYLRYSLMRSAIKNRSKVLFIETEEALNVYQKQNLWENFRNLNCMKDKMGLVLYYLMSWFYKMI